MGNTSSREKGEKVGDAEVAVVRRGSGNVWHDGMECNFGRE